MSITQTGAIVLNNAFDDEIQRSILCWTLSAAARYLLVHVVSALASGSRSFIPTIRRAWPEAVDSALLDGPS